MCKYEYIHIESKVPFDLIFDEDEVYQDSEQEDDVSEQNEDEVYEDNGQEDDDSEQEGKTEEDEIEEDVFDMVTIILETEDDDYDDEIYLF